MADGRRPRDLWRGTAAAPGRPAPAQGGGGRRWLWAAVFLAALGGAVAAWITFIRDTPDPIFLGLAVTEYQDPSWPPNPWAEQDAAALRELFGPDSARAFESQDRDRILGKLNQLATPGTADARRPIVVFVSANAVVRDGSVFLLPANARPDQPSTWLSLTDALEPLRRVGTDRLLVLDLQGVANPRLGVLDHDLNGAVRDELKRLEQAGSLPFPVLTGDAPGGNRVLRQGPFGLALKAGLQGRADTSPREGLVFSDEWVNYVRAASPRVSDALGFPPGRPDRFGPAADFRLLAVPTEGVPALPEPTPADPLPDWLLAAWTERDRWRDGGVHRRAPRTFLHLEASAHRAETRFLAGLDPGIVKRELEGDLRDLKNRLSELPPPAVPIVSLALARRHGLPKQGEAATQLAPLLEKVRDTPAAKPDVLDPLRKPLAEKAADREFAEAAADAAFEIAAGTERATPDQLKHFAGIPSAFRPAPRFVETITLAALAAVDPKRAALWPAGTARLVLQATREAERAVAFDPRCLPWLSAEVEAIDSIRRKALADLVGGPRADREAAPEKLLEAIRRYEVARTAGEALSRAFLEQDETRALLRSLAEFAPADPAAREEADRRWSELTAEARAVQSLLTPPGEPRPPDVSLLEQHSNDLRVRREGLVSLFRRLRDTGSGDPGGWLGWPGWSVPERKAFAERSGEYLLARSADAVRAVPSAPGPGPADSPADKTEFNTAAVRSARRAVDLLELAGDPEAKQLKEALAGFETSRSGEARESLAKQIRLAWAERLPERYRSAPTDDAREAIGWAVHPFDHGALPRTGDTAPRDAAAVVRSRQTTAYVRWLAERRYQQDAAEFARLADPAAKALANDLTALAFEALAAVR